MRKLYEEVYPAQYVAKGLMDVSDPSVRDNINTLLTGVLMSCTLTPYIALEKVRKTLSYFHIHISAVPFMEGDRGFHVFPVNQFGLRYGMKDNGQVVNFSTVEKDLTHGAHREGENFNYVETPGTKVTDEKYHIYFEYKMNDKGLFDIFCEIVTDDELQDLLDDAEEDINADKSEDDRDDRLNEAKNVATKVLNELRMYNSDGSSSINLPGPLLPGTDPRSYERRERAKPLPPGANPRDYLQTLPNIIDKPAGTDSSKSWDSNSAHTKPGGDGPPAGTDPFKGVEPRKPGTPSPALKPGEMSIHGNTNEPYTGPKTNFSGPDPKPMTSAEMKSGGYSQKIQETSHESVNHVRRLAMKKKINETDTMWDKAKELSGYNNISSMVQSIRQGNTDAALQAAGKAAIGSIPIVKGVQIAQTLNPKETSSQELDQIRAAGMAHARRLAPASARGQMQSARGQMQEDEYQMFKNAGASIAKSAMVSAATGAASGFARGGIPGAVVGGLQATTKTPETSNSELTAIQGANLANAKRLAPASTKHLIPIQRKSDVSNLPNIPEESSYESVNHVRKLAMKNKRNDR